MSAKKKAHVLGGLFGFILNGKSFKAGLIDAELDEEFHTALPKLESTWSHDFARWFRRNYRNNFPSKLIKPVRDQVGLNGDIGHTNNSETLYEKLKALFGIRRDIRLLSVNLSEFFENQKNTMLQALYGSGEMKVRQDMEESLVIDPDRANDEDYVQERLFRLFGCDIERPIRPLGLPVAASASRLSVSFEDSRLDESFKLIWAGAEKLLEADVTKKLISIWEEGAGAKCIWVVVCIKGPFSNRVATDASTGAASCNCFDFTGQPRKQLCKHTVAAASKAVMPEDVLAWQKESNLKCFEGTGGDKPGTARNNTRGNGNTKRGKQTRLDLDDFFGEPKRLCFNSNKDSFGSQPSTSSIANICIQTDQEAPWREGYEVSCTTRIAANVDSRVRCEGCRELLTEHPTHLGIVVVRNECDFQFGSKQLLPRKPRHYHMLTSCIRRRHPSFDPRGFFKTTMNGRWLATATAEEKEWVALFTAGDLD